MGGADYLMRNTSTGTEYLQLQRACRQFEAYFIEQILKGARRTMPGDSMANSSAYRTFREMLDQELANVMSQADGIGIADMLMAQMAEKK